MESELKTKGLVQITPESIPYSKPTAKKQEPDLSGASDGANQKPQIKRSRNPNCALCQNHGKAVPVKAHKRYCPWKDCPCSKCNVTNFRRKLVASQIAARRAIIQDKQREKEMSGKGSNDKVIPKEMMSSPNKTLENISIKHSTSRESFKFSTTPGSYTETATSSENSSLSSSFDSREYLRKYKSSKLYAAFPSMRSAAPVSQLQESLQILNNMYCPSQPTGYPIYRIRQDFGGDYNLAAAKIFEARYGPRSQIQMEEHLRLYSAYYQSQINQLPQMPSFSFNKRFF